MRRLLHHPFAAPAAFAPARGADSGPYPFTDLNDPLAGLGLNDYLPVGDPTAGGAATLLTPAARAVQRAIVAASPPPPQEERAFPERYGGGRDVSLAEVEGVPTPAATATYAPIPHAAVFRRVRAELELQGIGLVAVSHALYGSGSRYIGLGRTDMPGRPGADLVVGWFNSHDQSKGVTVLLGERVLVCFNLCLHAEIQITRRHTRHLLRDLPGQVAHAVSRIEPFIAAQARRVERYRETALPERDADHLLIRLLERGAIPAGQLAQVKQEWRAPRFPAFAADWDVHRLYQAVTYQPASFAQMTTRHRALHEVLDHWCAA